VPATGTDIVVVPLRCFLIAALLVAAGCQQGEVLGRVEGEVKLQGEPLAGACLIFSNAAKGVHIIAVLDDEGKFRVEMDKGYGLPLGDYTVSVSPPPAKQTFGPMAPEPTAGEDEFAKIPRKYRDAKTSGLSVTVREGIVNRLDIALEPEPADDEARSGLEQSP
jgi:hypothetical protein